MLCENLYTFFKYDEEVRKITEPFILNLGYSYFHFRRNFKDGSSIVLSNNSSFLLDFLENTKRVVPYKDPISFQKILVYFWDEFLPQDLIFLTRDKHYLHHGISIFDRHKDYYDCYALAMSDFHPSPVSWHLKNFNDLKIFIEKFPEMAEHLITKMEEERYIVPKINISIRSDMLYLPERSGRIDLGAGYKDYITTYELLCMQLLREGKSYKDIGSNLSMSPRTVETHLARLKRRTGLTFEELFLKSFKMATT